MYLCDKLFRLANRLQFVKTNPQSVNEDYSLVPQEKQEIAQADDFGVDGALANQIIAIIDEITMVLLHVTWSLI